MKQNLYGGKMISPELKNAIEKMVEIRKSRRERYGDGIFQKDLGYFAFLLKDKVERLTNTEAISSDLYETKLDTLIDIMTYSAIAYESQLEKSEKTEGRPELVKTIEINVNVENLKATAFFDGRFVGNIPLENIKLFGKTLKDFV